MTEFHTEGITAEDVNVEVSLTVEGDEKAAETVQMHAHNEIIKALQAIENGKHPDDCEGYFVRPDWDARLENIQGD